jgi:polysaccharide pyruvyl transferase WcaK-like protein
MTEETVLDEAALAEELERDLGALQEMVARAAEMERELDAHLTRAAARGASVRDLASATGLSKSTVARRLVADGPLRSPSADADDDEWTAAMQAERLRLAKLRSAKEATRLQIQQDQAALIREANALTRIGPLDLDQNAR